MMQHRLIQSTATLIFLTATAAANPQDKPWPGLDFNPGPHTAGFRVLQAYDHTRTFRPPFSPSGRRITAQSARPMPICLWYPANPLSEATPMRLADYLHLQAQETDFNPILPEERRQSEEALHRQLERVTGEQISSQRLQSILNQTGFAYRDSPPIESSFPVILAVQRPSDNWIFFEYLASHGYLVATVPPKGRMTREFLEFTPNPEAIEILINDLEFLYGQLRALPMADLDRSALWAFSSGSLYTLLYQMRHLSVRAMLHMEGWEGFLRGRQILSEALFYDPAAVRVPYLMISKQSEEPNPSYRSGRLQEAIGVFRLNADAYPGSANVWDSLAEALLESGDSQQAAIYYSKVLQIDPQNEHARAQLDEILGEDRSPWRLVDDQGPPSRFAHAMAFDSRRNRLVLFGGALGNRRQAGDTWEWDGVLWREIDTSRFPAPQSRYGHQMAYHQPSDQLLLFGGATHEREGQQSQWFPETWSWDGQRWTVLSNQGPSPRRSPALSYDPQRRTVVLFGGLGEDGFLNDTWEWDGTHWTELHIKGPAPRYSSTMAPDPSGGLLLYGGRDHDGHWYTDSWLLQDGQWKELQVEQGPSASVGQVMASDPQEGSVLLTGGIKERNFYPESWLWNRRSWSRFESELPFEAGFPAMTFDPHRCQFVLVGRMQGSERCETWVLGSAEISR